MAAAAKAIGADGGLDVLVNNAGIEGRKADGGVFGAAEVTGDIMRAIFETNVFGVVRVTHAFLPLLQRSAAPVIVNVSSGLGSMARMTAAGTPASAYPGVAYPASKAAVNMITVQYGGSLQSGTRDMGLADRGRRPIPVSTARTRTRTRCSPTYQRITEWAPLCAAAPTKAPPGQDLEESSPGCRIHVLRDQRHAHHQRIAKRPLPTSNGLELLLCPASSSGDAHRLPHSRDTRHRIAIAGFPLFGG